MSTVIDLPSWFFDNSVANRHQESVKVICIKLAFTFILGNFCLANYSPVINVAAFAIIVYIYINTIIKQDYYSLIIQLFFCNHFVFGNDKGGLFNIAVLVAIMLYGLSGRKAFPAPSSFGPVYKGLILVLFAFQLLSLTANVHASLVGKIGGFASFAGIIFLAYQFSKAPVTKSDIARLINVLFFFTVYQLVVSLNQKYNIIPIDTPLLPKIATSGTGGGEFDMDIFRCMGTLQDFEALAEYSLSLIAILLPGILSGSFKNISNNHYFMAVGIVFISFLIIVFTVTRSSFFLLPFVVLFAVIGQYKKMKVKSMMPFLLFIGIGIFINIQFGLIDTSAFVKRSADMKIKSLSDVASGSEINRGEIFAYAFNKIERSKGLIGEGYFANPSDYNTVHFDRPNPTVGDYHNLYLSTIVFWGAAGAIAFILIFLITIYRGFSARRTANAPPLYLDLILGFNIAFLFFLINQYKIIFLRESNYTVVVLIMLIIYSALIKKVTAPPARVVLS